jgi:hypothetical protein
MDAIDKRYLKSLVLGVYLVRDNGWLCDVQVRRLTIQASQLFTGSGRPIQVRRGDEAGKSPGSHTDHF